MFLFSETFIQSCKASTSVQTGVCTQVNPGSGGDLKDIFNCQMLNYFTSDVSYCLFFFLGGGASRGNLLSEGSWETAASQSHETWFSQGSPCQSASPHKTHEKLFSLSVPEKSNSGRS